MHNARRPWRKRGGGVRLACLTPPHDRISGRLHAHHAVGFDDVAHLHVVEVLQQDAALEAL